MSYAERALQYARDVLSGKVVACRYVKAACQRQLDDIERAINDPSWPYRFDVERANRVCAFMELLPHVEGKWAKPVVVDGVLTRPKIVLEPWQVFSFAVLFGWVHRETGLRRFRRGYEEVARKNAKSTKAAGTALYMLAADGEEGAQVYSAATKKDQAKIVWGIARRMIELEPDFRALGLGYTGRAIFQAASGSKYEPLGRDSDTQDGLSASCFISDELHAQKDRGLYDVLDSSTGARSQPLGLGITTAGSNTVGVCYEQRAYLVSILNATLKKHGGMGYRQEGAEHEDDTYFGIIYTLDHGYAPEPLGSTPAAIAAQRARGLVIDEAKGIAVQPDDDWADPDVWIKANPNLGVSVSLEDLENKCRKARASAQSQGEFRTKHCNQWVGSNSTWMDMTAWHACADPSMREEDFAHEECMVAFDAAFRTDIFAKVKVFRRDETYYALGKYWVPQAVLEQKSGDQIRAWANEGRVQLSAGPVVDIELVKDSLRADTELHVVVEAPYDPNQLTQFATEMVEEGIQMVEIRPSVLNFSEPMKRIEELVLQKRFVHNGDPVLAWMVGNVVCHRDAKDNIYPNKQGDDQKIDGAIALIMGMARMINAAPVASLDEFLADPIIV